MNKRFLYIGMVTIVIIIAGMNVKLNDSTNPSGLSLKNIEALTNDECGCNYTIKNRECYNEKDICANNDSGDSMQICPTSGVWCPDNNIRGCKKENITSSVCL
jgi:hypothetical protein